MWRLASGHRGIGLAGMKEVSNIPECYGLHGVYESGSLEASEHDREPQDATSGSSSSTTPRSGSSTVSTKVRQLEESLRMQHEDGGVKIVRPLLGESKSDLIATCRHHDMPWFEDHTNQDPSLTPRNAIRHLFGGHALPRALGKRALLELSANVRDSERRSALEAATFATRGMTVRFDPCAGTLRLRCDHETIRGEMAQAADTQKAGDAHRLRTMARKLRVFVDAVTPRGRTSMPDLTLARRFLDDAATSPRYKTQMAGVQIERRFVASELSTTQTSAKVHVPPLVTEWLFSRQPYGKSGPVDPPPCVVYPPSGTVSEGDPPEEWQLYDGRFWIRLINHTQHTLRLRPYRPEDCRQFSLSLNQPKLWIALQAVLKHVAPDSIRWTLPAVVLVKNDGSEEVVLLPTLRVGIPDAAKLMTCEVRYKKVGFVAAPHWSAES